MPVKTYLQTAITQVQTAMAEMEGQMHAMQQTADSQKNQIQSTLSNLEKERGMHMAAIGNLQSDGEKHMLQERIMSINRRMDDEKAKVGRIDSDLAQVQKRKDELHRNLYNAIGELTRLMSLPDIG